jgi:hypothetical protein
MCAIETFCKVDNSCNGYAARLRDDEAKGVRVSAKRRGQGDGFQASLHRIASRLALFAR